MLEEWTSAAKPKLDQALLVEHIEKMVEVRCYGGQLWSLRSRGQVFSGQSRLVLPAHHLGSHDQCHVQGPALSLQKAWVDLGWEYGKGRWWGRWTAAHI